MTPRLCTLLLVSIAIVAATLRLPQLDARPMHGDEAVHAVKCWELYQSGRYAYDPVEFHGPTLYYATWPILWLSGARDFAETTAAAYRLAPVVFGLALLGILALLIDGLGRPAVLWAALLTAVSPGLVFYSRYYIQETLLVFFTTAAIGCGWRYVMSRRSGWLVATGVSVGCMHATKETAIIAWGCMLFAFAVTVGVQRSTTASLLRLAGAPARPHLRFHDGLAMGSLAAILTSVALFSVGFTQWRGPVDSLRAYGVYFTRAGGTGAAGDHSQPWHYYLNTYAGMHGIFSEAAILLLALVAVLNVLRRRSPAAPRAVFQFFMLVYALALVVVYSVIPYKTPWTFLGPWHAMIMLAGVGAQRLTSASSDRAFGPRPETERLPALARRWSARAGLLICLLATAYLTWQSWRAISPKYSSDPHNPYVYAHPTTRIEELPRWIDRLAAASPDRRQLVIQVIHDNPWPLPWYLRGYARVGYWEQMPPQLVAPVIIAKAELEEPLSQRLGDGYQVSHYGMRPDAVLTVFCERALYERFAALQRQPAPASSPATRPSDSP